MTRSFMSCFLLMSLTVGLGIGCGTKEHGAIERLFERPLVVGASVSADTGSSSPGKRLGYRYSPDYNVQVVARGGTPGRALMQTITPQTIAGRSIVIGVDFMFWDTTLEPASESVEALQALIDLVRSAGVPLVLGDVPSLAEGRQVSRDEINREIHARCRPERDCHIVGLDEMHRRILTTGSIEVEGDRYTLKEIIPDGLHLSPVGSTAIANRILEVLRQNRGAQFANQQAGRSAPRAPLYIVSRRHCTVG